MIVFHGSLSILDIGLPSILKSALRPNRFLSGRKLDAGYHMQVVRNDAAPDILLETFPATPTAAIKTEGALQSGDPRFNACTEVFELLVHPGTPGHVQYRQTALLGKHGVLYPMAFGKRQVVFGGKPAITGNLPGHAAEKTPVTLQHLRVQVAVGRIAALDPTVDNQVRSAPCEKYLVTILGFTAALDDDIRVVFKEGNHFLRCGNLLPLEDSALALVHHSSENAQSALEFPSQSLCFEDVHQIGALKGFEHGDGLQALTCYFARIVEQIPVSGFAALLLFGVEDGHQAFFDDPAMIAVTVVRLRVEHLPFQKPAGHDPDTVGQQGRIRGIMDISLNRGGIDSNFFTRFDLFPYGITDDHSMNGLPGLFGELFDILLKNGFAGILPMIESGEMPEGRRVVHMKRQLVVRELPILLEDHATKHLLGVHPFSSGVRTAVSDQIRINDIRQLRVGIQYQRDLLQFFGNLAVAWFTKETCLGVEI